MSEETQTKAPETGAGAAPQASGTGTGSSTGSGSNSGSNSGPRSGGRPSGPGGRGNTAALKAAGTVDAPREAVANGMANAETDLRRQIAEAILAGDDAKADALRARLGRPVLRVVG